MSSIRIASGKALAGGVSGNRRLAPCRSLVTIILDTDATQSAIAT